MKIKAAVVREKSGPFVIEDVELDDPRENEVLVRITGSGLCHTDLVARDQYLPFPLPAVLGHEGSGVVEKIGSRVQKVKAGDHVVLSYLSCGCCSSCLKGLPTYCLNFFPSNFMGSRLDGSATMKKKGKPIHGAFFGQSSFASHAIALERNVVKVKQDVSLDKLGPLGCGVQTGAGGVMNSLKAEAGSSIAIFGMGSVGLSAVLAAVVVGCTTIVAVDFNMTRLALAREFGATHIIDPRNGDPVEEIRTITGGGAKYSLECTGIPDVLSQALDCLTLTGVCGLIGVAPFGSRVSLDCQNILNGRAVRGIVEGDSIPDVFIPTLIDLYTQSRFPFDRMITFYNLDQINQAAEDSEKGKTLKAVLRP
ncbi:MAG TPA: NAD(P)-dependent alcohol dehydrogenase [Syntrophorhabdaceae bacterium]|nr:NAD(P)-dependent alcohol dehydrogenase [Syntrophorhabdaceae bacterium]